MSSLNSFTELTLLPNCIDRWQIYYRLQDLDIPCECSYYKPLEAKIDSATTAIQAWSVVQQVLSPRDLLVARLERCWQLPRVPDLEI